jgi:hypothetical protein
MSNKKCKCQGVCFIVWIFSLAKTGFHSVKFELLICIKIFCWIAAEITESALTKQIMHIFKCKIQSLHMCWSDGYFFGKFSDFVPL